MSLFHFTLSRLSLTHSLQLEKWLCNFFLSIGAFLSLALSQKCDSLSPTLANFSFFYCFQASTSAAWSPMPCPTARTFLPAPELELEAVVPPTLATLDLQLPLLPPPQWPPPSSTTCWSTRMGQTRTCQIPSRTIGTEVLFRVVPRQLLPLLLPLPSPPTSAVVVVIR